MRARRSASRSLVAPRNRSRSRGWRRSRSATARRRARRLPGSCARGADAGRDGAIARPCAGSAGPATSSAPSCASSSRACASGAGGRRVEPRRGSRPSPAPQTASSSASGARSAARISGAGCGAARALVLLGPQAVADARPEPAGAAAPLVGGRLADAHGLEPRHAGARRRSAARAPGRNRSTMRMPSMVRLVSAIDVASTTLRCPGGAGAMAASCSRAATGRRRAAPR